MQSAVRRPHSNRRGYSGNCKLLSLTRTSVEAVVDGSNYRQIHFDIGTDALSWTDFLLGQTASFDQLVAQNYLKKVEDLMSDATMSQTRDTSFDINNYNY